jgi:hypothetical protein
MGTRSRCYAAATVVIALGMFRALAPSPAAALPMLTPHPNDAGKIWFEEDGVADGSSDHNHLFDHSVEDDAGAGHNHAGFAVWDNRDYRFGVSAATIPEGRFTTFWHGFIEPTQAPRYKALDGGATDRSFGTVQLGILGAAINEWRTKAVAAAAGHTTPDGSPLVTSIHLSLTTGDDFEFRVGFFDHLQETQQAVAAWLVSDKEIAGMTEDFPDGELGDVPVLAFEDDVDWLFSSDPNVKPTGDQVDFFTIALHEIGHVLGLDHAPGVGDLTGIIMRARIINEATDGRILRTVDTDSANGAAELYTQPVPEPPGPAMLAIALVAFSFAARRRPAAD